MTNIEKNYNCSICNTDVKNLFFCSKCRAITCCASCLENHLIKNHTNIYNKKQDESSNLSLFEVKGIYVENNPYYFTDNEINKFLIGKRKNGIIYELGSGTYSNVYLVKHYEIGTQYALKRMLKEKIIKKNGSLSLIKKEVEYQSKFLHKNICHLIGVYENKSNFYLILEYMNRGNLYSEIQDYDQKRYRNREGEVFSYFIQVINAVYFLHEHNILHRDIKPENILLNEKGECKLCDFGCCNETSLGSRNTFCGTMEYIAPEIMNENSYGKEVDVWSLGVLLFELTHGYTPFNLIKNGNKKNFKIYEELEANKYNFEAGMYFSSPEMVDLMKKMIVVNPSKRIKLKDVYSSSLVKKFEVLYILGQYQISKVINSKLENTISIISTKTNSNTIRDSNGKENLEIYNNNDFNTCSSAIYKNLKTTKIKLVDINQKKLTKNKSGIDINLKKQTKIFKQINGSLEINKTANSSYNNIKIRNNYDYYNTFISDIKKRKENKNKKYSQISDYGMPYPDKNYSSENNIFLKKYMEAGKIILNKSYNKLKQDKSKKNNIGLRTNNILKKDEIKNNKTTGNPFNNPFKEYIQTSRVKKSSLKNFNAFFQKTKEKEKKNLINTDSTIQKKKLFINTKKFDNIYNTPINFNLTRKRNNIRNNKFLKINIIDDSPFSNRNNKENTNKERNVIYKNKRSETKDFNKSINPTNILTNLIKK